MQQLFTEVSNYGNKTQFAFKNKPQNAIINTEQWKFVLSRYSLQATLIQTYKIIVHEGIVTFQI